MDRKITRVGIGALLVVGFALVVSLQFPGPRVFRGTSYGEPYPPAPEFTLTGSDGGPVSLSSFRGRIVLLFFGYSYCPDICPTTLAELSRVMDGLGGRAAGVQVIFISVDPGRDTSASMQDYAGRFDPTFIGLSGSEEELQPIWNAYGIVRTITEGTSASNYIVNHTARVMLIDPGGMLRLTYGFQTPPEDIIQDIEILQDAP